MRLFFWRRKKAGRSTEKGSKPGSGSGSDSSKRASNKHRTGRKNTGSFYNKLSSEKKTAIDKIIDLLEDEEDQK